MTRMTMILAATAFALTTAAPVLAQDQMAAKMSKADTAMMKRCAGMSHEKMARDAKCAAFMKAHPDAMKSGDAMMAHDDQMKKK